MWVVITIGSLIVIAVAYFFASNGRYYGRMFSEANFRQFHSRMSKAIQSAMIGTDTQESSPERSLADGTAFLTDAGLAVNVTYDAQEDGSTALHISFSQPGRVTTHSVASHFGVFVLAMLWDNKGELHPFFTDSGVHHMVFQFPSPTLQVQDFDTSYARYKREYRPIPFQHGTAGNAPTAAADSHSPDR